MNPPWIKNLTPRGLTLLITLSLVTAVSGAGLSLAGLLFPANLYPTEALRQAFIANDVVNLCIGLPILLGSLALARRGRLTGWLFWPGALFYGLYNTIAYAVAMPLMAQFPLYLAGVILGAYTITRLVSSIDGAWLQEQLAGAVSERLAGGVLAGFGILFFLRSIAQLAGGDLAAAQLGTLAADLLTTPVWAAAGVLLWLRKPSGYLWAAALLFQASMLFIGLLVFFILQPLLSGVPFPLVDFGVVFAMGWVCFIPFGLVVRGILRRDA